MFDIDSIYDPSLIQGKTVLVTGGNRGIGLALVQELLSAGAQVIATTRELKVIPEATGCSVISGIDVTDNKVGSKLIDGLQGRKIDILINNAGYFYGPLETIVDPAAPLNFEEELKMIDICAVGPLRITAALQQAGAFAPNAKVAMITSQGGSISWIPTRNPEGTDYGHHMSKAAANMMGLLVAQEFKKLGIAVVMLHPGFNRTEMTAKYADSYDKGLATKASVGAKRVMHEINRLTMSSTGLFINCEDGLEIPW